MEPTSMRRETR